MKLLFLNKIKKYTSAVLVLVFVSSLFFSSFDIKTAEGYAYATEPTQLLNHALLEIIAGETATIDATTAAIDTTTVELDAITGTWSQMDIEHSWWDSTVRFFKDEYFHISQILDSKSGLLKEYVLDPLFWTMANVVIDQFGDAIVNWIRNGFEGSPMFLSDPEGFFRDTANQVSGSIIDHFNMEWLCDPLGKLRINLDFFFPGTDRAKYRCTFNDIAGNFKNIAGRKDLSDWIDINVNVHQQNIVRLYGSDYRHGGLLMWLTTASWKNNDLGRTLQVSSDAYTAARVSVGFGKFQLFKNGGFLGMRKCVERINAPLGEGEMGPNQNGKCVKYIDTTPGQLVQDQLNNASSGDYKRLQVADEVNEIIGALATTMVGWMLTGGNGGGGVLAYDKNADYSASSRDHFGVLSDSQSLVKKKTDISGQVIVIKNGNDQYNNALKNYMGVSGDSENNTGIVLAKLKCIRATSTNDTGNIYDDSACLGVNKKIQNIKLTQGQIAEITADINKIENEVKDGDTGNYDEYEIAIAEQTAKLLDEFENKVMMTINLADIDVIIDEYCYSYDETAKMGTVCGLYTDKYGNTGQETHKTHSEEEADAINNETKNKVPELKTKETEYLCVLNKYTNIEKVKKEACRAFVKSG